MRYYFAGAYARRPELDKYAGWLLTEIPTAVVTSRWLTYDAGVDDAGFSAGQMVTAADVEKAWWYGQRDMEDIRSSRAIVSFTGEGTRGGRHIEHGIGLLLNDLRPITGYRLIVVGPREHIFHCHPATEVYPDWAAFLAHEIEQYREDPA
jgi:hypothetical protein